MWKKFIDWLDFQNRFLNFETAKGIYLVPSSVFLLQINNVYHQYIIRYAVNALLLYMLYEGLRKIWVNRVKQRAEFELKVKEKKAEIDVV